MTFNRNDGRSESDFRKVVITYEGLDRVDGSARFTFGTTECIVSVSGPVEVRPASENPSQATLEVFIRPLASLPGTDSKSISNTLKAIFTPVLLLSRHPRTLVQIVGQALCGTETGGGTGSVGRGWSASLTATLINATTAALINTGSIPMKGIVCAVAVGVLGEPFSDDRIFVVDPSETEVPSLSASGCFAFLYSSTLQSSEEKSQNASPPFSLIWTNFSSSHGMPFNEADLSLAADVASNAASRIWAEMKQSIINIDKMVVSIPRSRGVKQAAIKTEESTADESSDDEKVEI
ncbi:hypothetical protein QCA50_011353 [Cerrena zonata]|uniref:Exoribonuclease phosphorolytic domain-containing protein n=1 Tax=Cerrena zonata TaxID=2478898 RepID=A0AAW0G2E4_9APHY